MNDLIEQWVRPGVLALSAYHVANPRGLIKLDAMENPYTWPESLKEEWVALLRGTDVNRYPDPEGTELKQGLRQAFNVPEGAGLLLGNGSDEIIQMLALTLGGPGRVMLSVDPGFVMYRMIATFTGLEYVGVPLRQADFSLDMDELRQAIDRYSPALLFLAYPNNPSGNLFAADEVREIIRAAPGLVVVDEAYAPFTDESFLSEVLEHPNLLVMRTLSKMGLAGLRLGYVAGDPAWIGELDKTRMPYNINVLTQVSAGLALRHASVFVQQTRAIRVEREAMFQRLLVMDGVQPLPSQANFILCRTADGRALELFQGLKAAGVLIKNLHGAHPMLRNCLRVTVGRPEENAAFLNTLERLLQGMD